MRSGAVTLSGLGVLMVLLIGSPASAAPVDVPSCRLGAYLSDLYDLEPEQETFSARVWLWTLCPNQDIDPLPRVSLSNAASKTLGEPSVTFREGQSWDLVSLQGTFRHGWDVRSFPFDKHTLEILVTAPEDVSKFRFVADEQGSSRNAAISVPGWRITGFRLIPVEQQYSTGFGDPALPADASSTYSRMQVQIDLVRSDPIAFWKTIGPLFIVLLITLIPFAMIEFEGVAFRSRIAVLGAVLLTVLLNSQRADSQVPSTGVTMLNQLHILTLLWILLATVVTTISWRWSKRLEEVDEDDEQRKEVLERRIKARIVRLSGLTMGFGTLAYVLASIVLVLLAANSG